MRYRILLALLVAATAGSIAFDNGGVRPLDDHEIFVAQTATEMLERGDYLVPHYNSELRLEKPPLAYWLAIAAHIAVGDAHSTKVTEFEARLPSLICGLLLLLVVFRLGVVAFDDERVGIVAAALPWRCAIHPGARTEDLAAVQTQSLLKT